MMSVLLYWLSQRIQIPHSPVPVVIYIFFFFQSQGRVLFCSRILDTLPLLLPACLWLLLMPGFLKQPVSQHNGLWDWCKFLLQPWPLLQHSLRGSSENRFRMKWRSFTEHTKSSSSLYVMWFASIVSSLHSKSIDGFKMHFHYCVENRARSSKVEIKIRANTLHTGLQEDHN